MAQLLWELQEDRRVFEAFCVIRRMRNERVSMLRNCIMLFCCLEANRSRMSETGTWSLSEILACILDSFAYGGGAREGVNSAFSTNHKLAKNESFLQNIQYYCFLYSLILTLLGHQSVKYLNNKRGKKLRFHMSLIA